MAYSVPWDETRPPGATTPVSDVDTVIQDVQIAVRERAEQVIEDWGNDGVDPKILVEGSARVLTDVYASLPGAPAFDGQVFFATDTNRVLIGEGGSWKDIGVPAGVITDRPTGEFGNLWYRTGETAVNAGDGQVDIHDGVGWQPFAPFVATYRYDDSLAPGSKCFIAGMGSKIIAIEWRGTTDGAGNGFIDVSELWPTLETLIGVKNVLNENQFRVFMAQMAFRVADGVNNWHVIIEDYDLTGDNSINFKVYDADAGTLVGGTTLSVLLLLVG